MEITESFLDEEQYLRRNIKKNIGLLHHTASGHNPFAVKFYWNNTSERVATDFIIGGEDFTGRDDVYDGQILRVLPEGCVAGHVGPTGILGEGDAISFRSWSVELCSWGCLTYENGKFLSYKINGKPLAIIPKEYVTELNTPFKGYKFYHKYSEKQIESLHWLLTEFFAKNGVDIKNGLTLELKLQSVTSNYPKCFDFNINKRRLTFGLLTHGNLIEGKNDVYPDEGLIKMLLTL